MSVTESYVERKFSFCELTWDIESFCLAPGQKNWIFKSPDFYVRGIKPTKWRMIIRREHQHGILYYIKFTLKRLECGDYTETVQAEFQVHCYEVDGFVPLQTSHPSSSNFAINAEYDEAISPFAPDRHHKSHLDIYRVRCDLLVTFPNIMANLHPCRNSKLRFLSDSLYLMYKQPILSDCRLRTSREDIPGHKVVFHYRIKHPALRESILDGSAILRYDRADLDKFFKFLYSGNLAYAVTDPTISVYKIALDSATQPIIQYYEPDRLQLSTGIHVEEFNLSWTVSNFFKRSEEFFLSPEMTNGSMDLKWRWKVCPNGGESHELYTGVFLEVETLQTREICFNVSFDSTGPAFYNDHIVTDGKGTFGKEDIILCDNLRKHLNDGSLTIFLRLRYLAGEKYKESASIGPDTVKHYPLLEERIYEELREDVERISKDHNYPSTAQKFIRNFKI